MTIHHDTRPTLNLIRLANGEDLDLPAYESKGAAGMDLRAAVDGDAPLTLLPGKRALVPTGFIFEIPEGFEGQVRPRSGLAFKHGITCLNSPGTVDSD
ncbi:dUTP diphosphatase, partial [Rhizobium phaseoli]